MMTLRGCNPYERGRGPALVRELRVRVFRHAPTRAAGYGVAPFAGPYAVGIDAEEEQALMGVIWDLEARAMRGRGDAGSRRDVERVPYRVCASGVPGCVEVWVACRHEVGPEPETGEGEA